MLHLLAPHVCPVCDGLHRPGPIAAAELRPFFGTYLETKLPPVSADTIIGSVINTTFSNGTPVEMLRATVDKTGLWVASAYLLSTGGVEGSGYDFTMDIRYNGVSQGTKAITQNANQARAGGGFSIAPTQITSGQLITMYMSKGFSVTATATSQELRVTFVPTKAFPR
jgi:hypothetical protein